MVVVKHKCSTDDILEFKRRRFARQQAYKAMRSGHLAKTDHCELCKCSTYDLNAHHVDYGRPLKVIWLCNECHAEAHNFDHKLNPNNNPQTPMPPMAEKYDTVNVTFIVPVGHFLEVLEEARRQNKSVSAVVKQEIVKAFPVKQKKETNNDLSQNEQLERIRGVETDESMLPKSKRPVFQKVRRSRNFNLQQVGEQLPLVPGGYGQNARTMQRVGAC